MLEVETVRRTGRFELDPVGPYSISASARFLEGFAPAQYEGAGPEHLRFAFVADGMDRSERVAGAYIYPEKRKIVIETYGEAAPEVVRDQVERVLSLDVDGREFPEVGRRDPIVGRLQERYPGLRPVLFYSTYEAAAWARNLESQWRCAERPATPSLVPRACRAWMDSPVSPGVKWDT